MIKLGVAEGVGIAIAITDVDIASLSCDGNTSSMDGDPPGVTAREGIGGNLPAPDERKTPRCRDFDVARIAIAIPSLAEDTSQIAQVASASPPIDGDAAGANIDRAGVGSRRRQVGNLRVVVATATVDGDITRADSN